MTLGLRERALYARHLLLAEIGQDGQERLAAAHVELGDRTDSRVASVARDYLERAGVVTKRAAHANEPSSVAASPLVTERDVEHLAGDPRLSEVASFFAGAFVATEIVVANLGLRPAAPLPSHFQLMERES